LNFESLITEECTGMNPEAWNVPITWRIDLNGAAVASVTDDTGSLEDIAGA